MSSTHIGLLCLFLFALGQGVRDAYFANLFQSTSSWAVATVAFALSTTVFAAWSIARGRGDLFKILARPGKFAIVSLATAAAWLSFFYALRHLEPAVAATLFNGVGPLVVIVLGLIGITAAPSRFSVPEGLLLFGLALSLLGLAVVALTGHSGVKAESDAPTVIAAHFRQQAGALAIVAFGGAMMTTSYIFTKRLTDEGIGSDAVMSIRFLLMCIISGIGEFAFGEAGRRPDVDALPLLAFATFCLIVLPSFLVQFGVSRTSPLAANVFRTLGPVFVFAVQQLDQRLTFSGATLACIMAFCVFSIGASIIRGWHEARHGH